MLFRHLDVEVLRRVSGHFEDAAPRGNMPIRISRRAFMAGSGAVASLPILAPLDARNRVRFERDDERAVFLLDERPAWVIDPSLFSGTPRLRVAATRDIIDLELTGARVPGSDVCADFRARCRRRAGDWTIDLAFDFLSFRSAGSMQPWLNGGAALASAAAATAITARSNPLHGVLPAGEVTFSPDWHFRSATRQTGQLIVEGVEVPFAHWTLSIGTHRAGAIRHPAKRAAKWTIERGQEAWDVLAIAPQPPVGSVDAAANAFDALHVVLEESARGAARISLNARAGDRVAFMPGAALRNLRGGPATIPLRDVQFAAAYSGGRTEKALVASLATGDIGITLEDVVLHVADREDARSFELLRDARGSTEFRCAPRLVASLMPIEGGLALPVRSLLPAALQIGTTPLAAAGPTLCIASEKAAAACIDDCMIAVTRAADTLQLAFELRNVALKKETGSKVMLTRCGNGVPTLIVHFPPQAIGERAYLDPAEQPGVPPFPARAAGPSRLAFAFPDKFTSAPFTLETLLAWDRLTPLTLPDVRRHADIDVPPPDVTAIELPYRLLVAPSGETRWIHSPSPIVRDGRTELWHTRAATPTGDALPLRAVWSRDFDKTKMPNRNEEPFRMSINCYDRQQVVLLTHAADIDPAPAPANLLMLTSLGAWADIEALWPWSAPRETAKLDVEKWTHTITQGRDQHAIVTYRGYLYPWGHRAVLTKETTRVIATDPAGRNPFAYLHQKKYIVIKEPTRVYASAQMPLVRLTILDRQTPTLDNLAGQSIQSCATGAANNDEMVFWPSVRGVPFAFSFQAIDHAGNVSTFHAPAIFVSAVDKQTYSRDAQCAYTAAKDRRRVGLASQTVALARSEKKGDTEIEALEADFEGVLVITPAVVGPPNDEPPFFPVVEQIHARVPAVDQLLDGEGGAAWVRLRDPDTNSAEVFAELVHKGDLNASFAGKAERSGGVASPAVAVSHLSRRFGPVGATAVAGANPAAPPAFTFDPSSFFGNDAKILGTIGLKDIISALPIDIPEKVPAILSLRDAWTDGPDRIVQTMRWQTDEIREASFGFLTFRPRGGRTCRLGLNGTFEVLLADTLDASFRVRGALEEFELALDLGQAGGVILAFNKITFDSGSRIATSVDVDFANVDFTGALGFVKELTQNIGFGDVAIDVDSRGVTVTPPPLTIPDLHAGAFGLENLVISSSCRVPFTPDPVSFQFDFGRRDRPFLVSVGQFAGGGFLSMTVDAQNGLRSLAAAFEFGAMKEVTLSGIAHGRLFVFGGLYYRTLGGGRADVEFYVRAGGVLNALGFITLCVDLYLALRYSSGVFSGTATLTHSFEIGFIKQCFTVSYSQRFSGGGVSDARMQMPRSDAVVLSLAGDYLDDDSPAAKASQPPRKTKFADTMPLDEWKKYWESFAV